MMDLDDELLLRYSRQIMLPQLDMHGQEQLQTAKVLINGVGGLGSPVALYLAASGVGNIWLADPDSVDLTNLQRQIAHTTASVGRAKVSSARDAMQALNPYVKVTTIESALQQDELVNYVANMDVVVDATDNLQSRFEINKACVTAKTPLVSAAAIRWEGQITTFDARKDTSPCYQCLYGAMGEVGQTCSENGVLGSVVGSLGCMQATEVIKLVCGIGEPLIGRVVLYDGLRGDWNTITLKKDAACEVCGHQAA